MVTNGIYNFKSGDRDLSGKSIRNVYAREIGKYIIYDTDELELIIDGEAQASVSQYPNVSKLLLQIGDYISHTPSLKRNYNSSMAYALKILFDGNPKASYNSLRTIYKDIRRHLIRRAKISYQVGAVALLVSALLVFLMAYRLVGLSQFAIELFCAVIFSSMGGFLSVAIGTGKLKVDLQNSFFINMLYGALRIVIAMISGVLIYFLVQAKIIFAFLKDAPDLYGFSVIFFLSGFSEKLVPNLMARIEDTSEERKRPQEPSDDD